MGVFNRRLCCCSLYRCGGLKVNRRSQVYLDLMEESGQLRSLFLIFGKLV